MTGGAVEETRQLVEIHVVRIDPQGLDRLATRLRVEVDEASVQIPGEGAPLSDHVARLGRPAGQGVEVQIDLHTARGVQHDGRHVRRFRIDHAVALCGGVPAIELADEGTGVVDGLGVVHDDTVAERAGAAHLGADGADPAHVAGVRAAQQFGEAGVEAQVVAGEEHPMRCLGGFDERLDAIEIGADGSLDEEVRAGSERLPGQGDVTRGWGANQRGDGAGREGGFERLEHGRPPWRPCGRGSLGRRPRRGGPSRRVGGRSPGGGGPSRRNR